MNLEQGPSSWSAIRKAIAPSFSHANLMKTIPNLQAKIDDFLKVLAERQLRSECNMKILMIHLVVQIMDDHASNHSNLDVPVLVKHLSLDFILTSMFGSDVDALQVKYCTNKSTVK